MRTYPAMTAFGGSEVEGLGLKVFFRGNPTFTAGFDFLNERLDLAMASFLLGFCRSAEKNPKIRRSFSLIS